MGHDKGVRDSFTETGGRPPLQPEKHTSSLLGLKFALRCSVTPLMDEDTKPTQGQWPRPWSKVVAGAAAESRALNCSGLEFSLSLAASFTGCTAGFQCTGEGPSARLHLCLEMSGQPPGAVIIT